MNNKKYGLKKTYIIILLIFSFFSCNKSEKKKAVLKEPVVIAFGFKLNNFDVVNDTIHDGDTFGSILEKQNLGNLKVHEIVEKVKDTFDVRMMRIDKPYTLLRSKDKSKKIRAFIYQPDHLSYYVIDLKDSIKVYKHIEPVTYRRRTIAGKLDGSLSESLVKKGVDGSFAVSISKVYAWSIDFFKPQKGDKFAVTFTERYIKDSIYDGVDSLKCCFFEYKGKLIYAFPFSQEVNSNKIEFFDEQVKTLKNFFLKAPLKFVNITSHYSKNRFHPAQQVWKAHKGTDYAAPYGAPIMTTASGVVEQTGFTAGNGNFVKVKHNGTYSTQYLHMSKIIARKGQRVNQGDVIGKVGSTGLATGPHVCYRFWKNGVQVDALKLNLPNSEPMGGKNLPRFIEQMTPLKKELDRAATIEFKRK